MLCVALVGTVGAERVYSLCFVDTTLTVTYYSGRGIGTGARCCVSETRSVLRFRNALSVVFQKLAQCCVSETSSVLRFRNALSVEFQKRAQCEAGRHTDFFNRQRPRLSQTRRNRRRLVCGSTFYNSASSQRFSVHTHPIVHF